jgi:transposase
LELATTTTRRGRRQYASPQRVRQTLLPAADPCDLLRLLRLLHGPHRVACRLLMILMILLSQQGFAAAQIADLLGYDPATVRRWIHRYRTHGTSGLADRPRSGRPRLGSPRLGQRIRRLLTQPRAWTIPRLWHALGRPPLSRRTLHRRVREVARWRRPRLVAKGDPTATRSSLTCTSRSPTCPWRGAAGRGRGPHQPTQPAALGPLDLDPQRAAAAGHDPGKNRRRTIFGAIDMRTGRFLYQVTRKAISASFTSFTRFTRFCEHLLAASPPRQWSR